MNLLVERNIANEAAPWATFDCYGTLVDWVTGMRRAVESLGVDDPERLLRAYYSVELEVEREQPGARYREILAETLRRAAARERIPLPPGGEHVLAERWDDLPVFGDTVPALEALQSDGWRLAILTNCDNDLVSRTVEILGIDFDQVVTAEDVGSYKPDHGHWHRFAQRSAQQRSFWAHVACSWVHDIEPARDLQIPRVWVDRERTGHDPAIADAVLGDLTLLPETLEGLRSTADRMGSRGSRRPAPPPRLLQRRHRQGRRNADGSARGVERVPGQSYGLHQMIRRPTSCSRTPPRRRHLAFDTPNVAPGSDRPPPPGRG